MKISKNEKVRIGDTAFVGAETATLDFAKDRRGDYILAGDGVIADAGDGIDTYEVLKVLPGNKVKLGGLGVEMATVDAKSVSVARKHGILKRDGDTVVLKNALDYSNIRRTLSKFNFRTNFGNQVEYVEAPESRDNNIVIIGYKESSGRGGGSEVPISQGLAMKMIAELKKVYRVDSSVLKSGKLFVTGCFTNKATNSSRNSVVANAIAWRARNSSFDGKSVKTGKIHKDSPMRGFYQFISDDGIMALDASDNPREAKRIAEKAGFKVHS